MAPQLARRSHPRFRSLLHGYCGNAQLCSNRGSSIFPRCFRSRRVPWNDLLSEFLVQAGRASYAYRFLPMQCYSRRCLWRVRKNQVSNKEASDFLTLLYSAIVFGVGHMNGAHGLEGWRWLFIVEGIPSSKPLLYPQVFLDSNDISRSGSHCHAFHA